MRDTSGNLPMQPGIYPDYSAPIVRNAPDGERELAMVAGATRAAGRGIAVCPLVSRLLDIAFARRAVAGN